ncbi:transcription factor MYB1R1 isoform X2 [Olea europaea subsp. europaea]|uniref:Transcription factor MYB1R1 isoform X2 n=1 Tax=Olea europaea subsp. europaea TaxID=158383 RepID=A0A8S0R4A8_OLEEU|nr:transcription factor MYB1R1 isoform X2 [Olea europaea subsp. europaea]
MTRKCSHCSHNGHNSRTCPNRGVKLFGVRLTDESIRKSASMGNLTHYMNGGTGTPQNGVAQDSTGETPDHASGAADGYASDDFVAGSASSRERKKGIPWTEEEHRMFLLGLQKLGKGDWRGIARNFVISRSPTQVASHAQKYFVRQCSVSRRKRRTSLFDIVVDESVDTPVISRDISAVVPPEAEMQSSTHPPPPAADEECESMECANSNEGETMLPKPVGSQYTYPVVCPAYVTPYFPLSFPFLPGYNMEPVKEETHEVLKPTAVHSKSLINVDELIGMSKLSIGESLGDAGKSTLSLKLVEGSTRPSAFHANHASGGSRMNSSHSPIRAV